MKKAELKEENRELKADNKELYLQNENFRDINIKRKFENIALETQIKAYLQTITDLTNEMNAIDLELSELKIYNQKAKHETFKSRQEEKEKYEYDVILLNQEIEKLNVSLLDAIELK